MSEHVRVRTDHGNAGWWCDVHKIWTGELGWCFHCDGPLMSRSDEGNDEA
jgi:hypothetical protein